MTPVYIVQERESPSLGRGVGTGVAVGAVGVLLYLLIKNLGLGGRRSSKDEASTILPMPKDEQRLSFVMTHPTADDPAHPVNFRGPGARVFSLEELISRVKAGGRSDVTLKITGNVREGSAASAAALIKQAGLEVWKETSSGTHVSGNARGQYRSFT